MQLQRRVRTRLFLFVALSVIVSVPNVYAQAEPQSNSYKFQESAIGTGGVLEANSANYKATNSTGDLGIGNSAGMNYQTDAGSQTTNDPSLAVSVGGAADLGDFSPTTTAAATSTFTVSNYTSYGYVVNIMGTPPTQLGGSHVIAPIAPASPPDPGPYTASSTQSTEQFGINLKANTSPMSIGANPVQSFFGVGEAAANYNTSDEFRYVSGEAIASAPKSSGVTTYTITYLVNVSPLTLGGKYACNQTLIVTGTY